MFIPIGLALGALSTVSSLVESAATSMAKAGGNDPLTALAQAVTGEHPPAAQPAGKPAASQLAPGTLAALLALQGQGGKESAAAGLFAKLDTNRDGVVSKSELESALGNVGVDKASADAAFGTLDANGDGGIGRGELGSAAAYLHRQRQDAAALTGNLIAQV
jgi:EF hand